MRAVLILLLLAVPASAQFSFPPTNSTQFQVAGVTQVPQPSKVNFSTGLAGSYSPGTGVLTITATAPHHSLFRIYVSPLCYVCLSVPLLQQNDTI